MALILVRHGRTTANAAGLLQGHIDNPLDELGVRQAAAIAVALAGLDRPRVLSSPLLRARQTASALQLPVQVEDRFIELDYGGLDGLAVRDVDAATWARWRAEPDFVPAGGESLARLQARVEQACAEALADGLELRVVLAGRAEVRAVLDGAALDAVFTPGSVSGATGAFIDRVLSEVRAW